MALTAATPELYYGHGEAMVGPAVAGAMPAVFDLPLFQIDMLELSFAREVVEHISKRTSIAKKDAKVTRYVSGTGKITCSEQSADLLKLYLFGTKAAVAGGSVSATTFAQTTTAVGEVLPLPGGKKKVTSLVVTDSAGSPVTLTLGTHYEADADGGYIKILDLTGLTQPLKAAFTESAGAKVDIFQTQPGYKGMRFKGINLMQSNRIEVVDFGKLDFSPAATWSLLSDGNEVNKYELEFEILEDTSNTIYPYGQYRV
jgi:hypothetical protein